jgi:UDP-N-acetylmuramyl pentapeptide phosphotransferase/UDP-N-acetylglucosamine-1-phosphate transferase
VSLPILLAVSALGAAVSWITVAVVRDAARRRGLLDMPNARSSHGVPTPRLGGLGIVAGVIAALGLAAVLGADVRGALVPVGLGVVVAAVSLIDDVRSLPALTRLVVHLAAGAAAVAALGPTDVIRGLGVVGPQAGWIVDAVLTVVWVTGFMNAFNFMDGIDGIAGGQGAVAGAAAASIGWTLDAPVVTVLGASQAAACLGFLPHNWSPATIFMGDVGSAFLGFLIAATPLVAPSTAGPSYGIAACALIVWPFLFDTILTFVRRSWQGENVMAAHRTHLYQRLTQAGWLHGRVAALYTALAVPAAVLVASPGGPARPTLAALAFAAVAAWGLWRLVVHTERQRPGHASAAGRVEDSSRA